MTSEYAESVSRVDAVRRAARRAALELAREDGAQIVRRPIFAGADVTARDVEPLAGLRASRELEIGARYIAHGYLRQAREDGYSWHAVGVAMGLRPGRDGETIAEAAFTYAAGDPDSEYARRYGRSFGWTCTSCDKAISDHGLETGPVDGERGHAPECQRHAATMAAWEAEWEAGE